jgi:hypothetical protein
METKGFKPKSFNEAAGAKPATPAQTGKPNNAAEPAQLAQAEKSAPPKPPKGVSGSGYTRIPNGKLVRNRRPAVKPLPLRQAKNWRARATTELVAFLKEREIGVDDPKPTEDTQYLELVSELENSKAYLAYVKLTDEPFQVHEFRGLLPGTQKVAPVEPSGEKLPGTGKHMPKFNISLTSDYPTGPVKPAVLKSTQAPPVSTTVEEDEESSEDETTASKPKSASPPAKAGPTLRQKGKALVDKISTSK